MRPCLWYALTLSRLRLGLGASRRYAAGPNVCAMMLVSVK